MPSATDTLLDRARLAARDRIREVLRALGAARSAEDPGLGVALRELHAIKGEASMSGLRALSRVAHALEALLIRRRATAPFFVEDACEALRVLDDLLKETPASELDGLVDLEDLRVEIEATVSGAAPGPRPGAVEDAPAAPAPRSADGSTPEEQRRPPADLQQSWLRIETRDIDDLCTRVSELAADVDGARRQLTDVAAHTVGREALRTLQALDEGLSALRARVGGVEDRTWALRVVAIQPLLQELAAHAERLASELGKSVRVEVDGGGVALERGVVEALREPLLHLVRNAIDHGIESPERRGGKAAQGAVRLSAATQATEIVLAIEDDGAGLDVEAIRERAVSSNLLDAARATVLRREEVLDLVFLDGFSQRDEASEISGRGIGLGAARAKVERMGGAMRLTTTAGKGARFELVLSASAGRERVVVVEAAGVLWAIPSRWVRAVLRGAEILATARAERFVRTQEGILPVHSLSGWLGGAREEEAVVLVVEIAGRRRGLLVAPTLMEVDLFRIPASPLLAAATPIAASGGLEDGRPIFFLRWSEVLREGRQHSSTSVPAPAPRARKPRVLVVDDSPVIRDIVGEILTSAGVEVLSADNGKAALELIARQPCDLVITDLEMPRMTGLELLEHIRKDNEILPVVVLTTRNRPEHRREAALLGANAYIAKSEFRGENLMDVVRRFIDLPS